MKARSTILTAVWILLLSIRLGESSENPDVLELISDVRQQVSQKCQRQYDICYDVFLQDHSPDDLSTCQFQKSTKSCFLTSHVDQNSNIGLCTENEYQMAHHAACMSPAERKALKNLKQRMENLQIQCTFKMNSCWKNVTTPLFLKDYCTLFTDTEACLVNIENSNACQDFSYNSFHDLACSTGSGEAKSSIIVLSILAILTLYFTVWC